MFQICVYLHVSVTDFLDFPQHASGSLTFKPWHSHLISSAPTRKRCLNLSNVVESKDAVFSWRERRVAKNTGKRFTAGYFQACWQCLDNGNTLEIYSQLWNVTMVRCCKKKKNNYFNAAKDPTMSLRCKRICSHAMLIQVPLSTKDCSRCLLVK